MSGKNIDDLRKKHRFTGASCYREIFDQEFTHEEARDAADFGDLINSYLGFPSEDDEDNILRNDMMRSFIKENMELGHRLYMALHLPIDSLGALSMNEKDKRVVVVINKLCDEINKKNDGRSSIILPSEA